MTIDEQIAQFHANGFVVIPDAVPASYLAALQEATAGEIYAGGTVRNLLDRDPLFEDLIDGHAGMELLDALMPDLQLLAMDLRACPPGGGEIGWHADRVLWSEQTLTVHTALYLHDLTPDNGALRVVPGSHKRPFDLPEDERLALRDDEILVTCPAGTLVVFDDCTWHRTGRNVTERPRRGIFTYYGRFWIKPTSYRERPRPFAEMRHLWEGRGPARRRLLGIEHPASEFNHPFAWEDW